MRYIFKHEKPKTIKQVRETVEVRIVESDLVTYIDLYFENGRHIKVLGLYEDGTVQTLSPSDSLGGKKTTVQELQESSSSPGAW